VPKINHLIITKKKNVLDKPFSANEVSLKIKCVGFEQRAICSLDN